jgi:hypothetical protein
MANSVTRYKTRCVLSLFKEDRNIWGHGVWSQGKN